MKFGFICYSSNRKLTPTFYPVSPHLPEVLGKAMFVQSAYFSELLSVAHIHSKVNPVFLNISNIFFETTIEVLLLMAAHYISTITLN
jgi:hypothetical protein